MMIIRDADRQMNPAITRRQAAFDDLAQSVVDGFSAYEDKQKTKRAEALAKNRDMADLKDKGYAVTSEEYDRAINGPKEPSGLDKLKSFFTGEKLPEAEKEVNLYGKRTKEWEDKQARDLDSQKFERKLKEADLKFKQDNALLDRQYKMAQMDQMSVENQKKIKEMNQLKSGKQLTATEIAKFDEGNQIPAMLQDIKGTLGSNKDSFGPVSGRISSMNPWDEKAQTIESQFKTASQAFGKFMEGGVLRKEDEDKYRKMFPNQSDTPEVAANKLANVERLLAQRQGSTISALGGAGYDVSSIDKKLSVPNVPSILSGKGQSPVNAANAGEIKKQLSSMSREEKLKILRGN